MRLEELENNAEINITAKRDNKIAKFISEVIKPISQEDKDIIKELIDGNDYTVINLITVDDKRINFNVSDIHYTIISNKEGKAYYWKESSIVIVHLPDLGDVHVIVTDTDGVKFNRRDDFRLWLGQDGTVKFGDNKAPHNAVLKDISISGVGIFLKSDYDINVGDKLFIQFKDEYVSNTNKEYTSKLYSLEAEVVRVVPKNERINLVGCKITKGINEIQKFLVHKQSERIRVGGRKALYNKKKDSELFEDIKD